MSYTNSPLAGYTKLSKNRTSPRNHAIDTITIHCVVGQWTAKQTCDYFAGTDRQASCNYAVGKDGSIGLCVEEKDRSWCSSNPANDNRAVTIEVASDTTHPYAVTDAAYKALIELVADICRRNGIKKLIWSTDKNVRVKHLNGANMTVHRDFASKACPGDYLYNRHGDIAAKVNAKLGTASAPAQSVPASGTAIMGKAQIPAARLAAFLLSKNGTPKLNGVNAEQLAQLYISEGEAEGIRGDLAFCQSCVETGYWQFKGDVKPTQNNFSGIGATGGVQGASFPDAKTGIRAQIQHIKAYASKDALRNPCVDPRYNLVTKGCAPTLEGLSGRWAADKGYAEKILAVYKEAEAFSGGTAATKFPYLAKVTADALNVRSGPGTSYKINTVIRDQGTYTITEEKNGWGRLVSGAGWISLAYTKKV